MLCRYLNGTEYFHEEFEDGERPCPPVTERTQTKGSLNKFHVRGTRCWMAKNTSSKATRKKKLVGRNILWHNETAYRRARLGYTCHHIQYSVVILVWYWNKPSINALEDLQICGKEQFWISKSKLQVMLIVFFSTSKLRYWISGYMRN